MYIWGVFNVAAGSQGFFEGASGGKFGVRCPSQRTWKNPVNQSVVHLLSATVSLRMPTVRKPGNAKRAPLKKDQPSSAYGLSSTILGPKFVVLILISVLSGVFIFARQRTFNLEMESSAAPFKVVDLPGKGKGVIASRDIEGELLIRERPLFIVPRTLQTSPTEFLGQLLAQLSKDQVESFFNLSYVNLPAGVNPDEHRDQVALAIMQTNGVSAGSGVALAPRMARLNHGCSKSFNAVYSWRESTGEIVVHALKAITTGQEILTTYLDTKKPRSERRAYLESSYGFACACETCSLPDEESKESDERLRKMTQLRARFSSWGTGQITGQEAIQLVRQIWALGDQEGYWSERGILAADACLVAAAHSDSKGASDWARIAVKWYAAELGGDSPQVSEIQRYVEHPNKHRAWGTRQKLVVGGF